MKFNQYVLLLLLSVLLLILPSDALFGKKKGKKEEDREPNGKESFQLGKGLLADTLNDPAAITEALAMSKDPEIMREVEALMDDPLFQAEMEKYMKSDTMKKAIKSAEKLANDPQALKVFQQQMQAAMAEGGQQVQKKYTGKQNAHIGLETLASSVQDPSAIAQAMDMLKDPETAKQVDAMMKDPQFQVEMRRITENPTFKNALKQAEKMTEELKSNPAKAKEFMKELENAMGAYGGGKATGRRNEF